MCIQNPGPCRRILRKIFIQKEVLPSDAAKDCTYRIKAHAQGYGEKYAYRIRAMPKDTANKIGLGKWVPLRRFGELFPGRCEVQKYQLFRVAHPTYCFQYRLGSSRLPLRPAMATGRGVSVIARRGASAHATAGRGTEAVQGIEFSVQAGELEAASASSGAGWKGSFSALRFSLSSFAC